jgi:hypothetical protein
LTALLWLALVIRHNGNTRQLIVISHLVSIIGNLTCGTGGGVRADNEKPKKEQNRTNRIVKPQCATAKPAIPCVFMNIHFRMHESLIKQSLGGETLLAEAVVIIASLWPSS